jgi:thymidylate synthase
MYTIDATNVNDAFFRGVRLLINKGERKKSRARAVLVMDAPVMTIYRQPTQRVLFHSKRDANPFFHLMEALWMLAGWADAKWLDQFVSDFSKRFAEEDGIQHGAYGFRWRYHFDLEGGMGEVDQLETIVRLLKKNSEDRRIVLTMWDPMADLGRDKKDIPCNTHVYFRVREVTERDADGHPGVLRLLDMTVCCRSNDAVWGAYGANAVHFSVLQEYMATRVGVTVGRYYQLSNNFHVYENVLEKLMPFEREPDPYQADVKQRVFTTPVVTFPDSFDSACSAFMHGKVGPFTNSFFHSIALPMKLANAAWKRKDYDNALALINMMPLNNDWRLAAYEWMRRRMLKKMKEVA